MRYLLKVFQFEPLKQNQPMEIDVQDIDHLGLIAGIVDEKRRSQSTLKLVKFVYSIYQN